MHYICVKYDISTILYILYVIIYYMLMKKLLLCLLVAGTVTPSVYAQKCLTSIKTQQRINSDPQVAQRVQQLEAFTQEYINNNAANKTTAVDNFPIVVHVLYSTSQENISDAQINSQLPILNAAFTKTNANAGSTPAAFQSVAADAEMQFCLAKADPNGAPTTGITRTMVSGSFDGEYDYFNTAKGGVAPWDPNKYINVYIVKLNGTLGFTYTPGTAPAGEDGVVIDYRCWGNTGTASTNQPNHLGTTAVHEFGHYFNLEHIWGVNNSGCSDDDNVADTPPQDTESGGCPTFPYTDNCTSSGNGIMFMNFMDYSDDDCMTMFTEGQKQRMKAAIAGHWAALANSTACNPLTVAELSTPTVSVYPNPANMFLTIELSIADNTNAVLINSVGQAVKTINTNAAKFELNTSRLPNGVYYLKIQSGDYTTTRKITLAH